MDIDIDVTEEFETFFTALDETTQAKVSTVIEMLQERGASLGYPYSSALSGTTLVGLRELRTQLGKQILRIFYWISEDGRRAVLLLGFDKKGLNEHLIYRRKISQAEKLQREYTEEPAQ